MSRQAATLPPCAGPPPQAPCDPVQQPSRHPEPAEWISCSSPAPSSPAPILNLLNGFRSFKVLSTLVALNIPDAIHRHCDGEVVDLQSLAAHVGANNPDVLGHGVAYQPSLDGLERLLSAAVSLGLLAGSRDGYRLTDLSRAYLLQDVDGSLAGYVQHSDVLYRLWGELPAAVLSGTNCWQRVYGRSSGDVFAALYDSDAAVLRFMRGMDGFSQLSARPVLTAFDLAGFRHLVDLGGATGTLAAAACALHPHLSAVVVDLPNVVDMARRHFGTRPAAEAVAPRLSWVVADMFGPPEQLPDGDLFVLSRVLHDWDEARCSQLLRSVFAKLPPGGALLVAEMLLDESGTSPPEVLLQSLNMLTQTHGRERRLSEYRHLLQDAGFTRVEGKRTGAYLDAIIAYKPQQQASQAAAS